MSERLFKQYERQLMDKDRVIFKLEANNKRLLDTYIAIARLLRVAREMDEMLEHMEDMSCVSGYYVDNAREALKEVEDLL